MGYRKAWAILLVGGFCVSAYAPTEIETRWRKAKGPTLSARIESVSQSFLGAPYSDFPLGEGPGDRFDAGPTYRFDTFDCTTFVETVLALATAKTAAEFEPRLRGIRYHKGQKSFVHRNHFPCVDWIPHNTQSGLLTDITEKVGAPWGTEFATAPVDKKGWLAKLPTSIIHVEGLTEPQQLQRLAELRAQGQSWKVQHPSVPYIPLSKILVRTEVTETEKGRRLLEEEALAKTHRENSVRKPQSEPVDLEKEVHDALIDHRLKYLIQDVKVDEAFLAAIPTATLLNVVRPGWKIPGTQMNISHQGWVIRKKGGVYFRHVSRSGGRAKDVPLANYLRLCLLIPAIKGINLLTANP